MSKKYDGGKFDHIVKTSLFTFEKEKPAFEQTLPTNLYSKT